MAAIKDIQIGEETFKFNKLISDTAKIEVDENKIALGIHPDKSDPETLLAVGFGASEENPSNAIEVTYSGKIIAKEEVQVGEHKLTNKMDSQDIKAIKLISIADYVKLTTKENNVLYLVYE